MRQIPGFRELAAARAVTHILARELGALSEGRSRRLHCLN
jgi:hypothetical protein